MKYVNRELKAKNLLYLKKGEGKENQLKVIIDLGLSQTKKILSSKVGLAYYASPAGNSPR